MEINNEIRLDLYRKSFGAQRLLFGDAAYGKELSNIASHYYIHEAEKLDRFIVTIGDIILGFYKIEDTVPLLQQELGMDPKTAALLGAEVLDFLAPLSDPDFVVPSDDDTDIPKPISETTVPSGPLPTNSPILDVLANNPAYQRKVAAIDSTPATTVATPTPYSAPELRTMAADMARSPERSTYSPLPTNETLVYSSEQPTVQTALSDLPAYHTPNSAAANPPAPIEPARWGN